MPGRFAATLIRLCPILLAAVLISSACSVAAPAGPTRLPDTEVEELVRAIALTRVELSSRLGIDADGIVVESTEAVTWDDTSLGCPEPGMMYSQVLVPGYRIQLQANGETFEYHTEADTRAVLCMDGKPAASGPTPDPGDIKDSQPWMPVY